MQPEPKLDYANDRVGRSSGSGSAVASFCLGLLVGAEAIWAITIMWGLDPRGDTDGWMILGSLLLMGAVAAAIGLACAIYGRVIKAPLNRFRRAGEILNGCYLAGYVGLLVVVAIWW